MITATSSLADHSAAALIGKAVESQTGHIEATGQPVAFAFDPVAEATSVVAQVRDSSGKVVRDIPLTTGAERQQAAWDGRDKDGKAVAAGPYTLQTLYYKDKDLLSQAAAITHSTVTEVQLTPTGSLLKLADGSTLPLSQVQAISAGS